MISRRNSVDRIFLVVTINMLADEANDGEGVMKVNSKVMKGAEIKKIDKSERQQVLLFSSKLKGKKSLKDGHEEGLVKCYK